MNRASGHVSHDNPSPGVPFRIASAPEPVPLRAAAGRFLPGSTWVSGTLWAICDQGVWSLANFLFNLYLVGLLGPHRFGVYSVAFSVYLVCNSVQNSLLLEPMSVVWAAAAAGKEPHWSEAAVRIQTRLGLLGALMLGAAAAVAYRLGFEFATCMAAVAIGFPFTGAVALRRRVAYMEGVPYRSVMAGVLNLTAVFISAAVCRHFGLLTAPVAFLILGLASLPALVSLSPRDSFRWYSSSPTLRAGLGRSWAPLWRYGKWSGAAAASGLLGSVLYPPLLAALSGYDTAGLYRSMEYLFLPATQALTAVSVFSTPKFSSQFSHAGILASRRSCARYVLALIGAAIVYSLFAFLFFGPLARHLLGAAYASATWMIPFFSFTLLLRALGDAGIGVILRGAHRPNAVFIASALSAAAVAGFGYPLCRLYGVSGLLYGSCFASLLQTGAYIWYYFREIRLAKLESAAATSPGPLDMQTTRS